MSHQLFGIQSAVGLPKRDVSLSRYRAKRVVVRHLEISPQSLLSLYRFEQRLEVSGAKTLRAFPFDDLIEDGRPVFDWLREYLKQIPLVITIDENPQFAQRGDVFIDMANAIQKRIVVRPRDAQEFYAALTQSRHRRNDVVCRNRDVLYSGAVVELEIFVDLRLLLSFGWLVDRKLDPSISVGHHLRHQCGIFSRDRLVIERENVHESKHMLVKCDPFVHRTQLDVADTMIDILETG